MIRSERIRVVADSKGAADVRSVRSLSGCIQEIRCIGEGLNNAGKSKWTITRADDAGAILTLTADGPWTRSPRQATHNVEGVAALYAAAGTAVNEEIPIDGLLRVQIAEAKAGGSGELVVFYEE